MTTTTIDATEMFVVHELKMTAPDMGWMAKALLAAAATDEQFGIKCHAHINAGGLTAVAEASDGYRAHQLHLPLRASVDPVDVVVPRDALTWASKNVRTFTPKKDSLLEPVAVMLVQLPALPDESKQRGWVSMIYREWDDDTAPSARFDAPLIREEYPRITPVIDKARQAPPAMPAPLNLDFIADTRTLATALTTPPTIAYTTGLKGRAGPSLLDFWEGAVLRATALIAPSSTDGEDDA